MNEEWTTNGTGGDHRSVALPFIIQHSEFIVPSIHKDLP
jgi:hypothetical protein